MTGETAENLPDLLPTGDVTVEREQHRYLTYEGDNGSVLEEREYTLNKAPIQRIKEVQGVHDGESVTFTEGTDYNLSNDKERIVWLDGGKRPDAGSLFYVTYRAESIISRYLESNEEELDSVENQLSEVISAKFVDEAQGEELDQIGEVFGVLGKRRGRSDEQYRIYLKSVVQSFISRGTVSGIKAAISAATGIDVSEITIDENFVDVSYDVKLPPESPHQTSTIVDIAEVADPSGAELGKTRYTLDPEETGITDGTSFTEGINAGSHETGVTDGTGIDTGHYSFADAAAVNDGTGIDTDHYTSSETAYADDANAIDANKNTVAEGSGINDTATPRRTAVAEGAGSNDSATTSQATVEWDTGSWDSMDWAVEHN